MSAPKYRVLIYGMSATFGPGTLLANFENVKNIGWSRWLNEVSSAFFTIDTKDGKLAALRPYEGLAHVKIYRDSDLVWAGLWLDHDGNSRDTILYAYSYEACLYWTTTDWATEWSAASVLTIVTDCWTRAKTTLTSSTLAWVSTGTLQAPVTTSGGATAITLPFYQVFYKKTLQVFQELAALGASDTTNAVWFEITPAGVFNFWKNNAQDRNVVWEYGSDLVSDYGVYGQASSFRNDLLAVGASPNDPTLRVEKVGTSLATYGRRMAPVFYSYVRDATEIDRVTSQRLALAQRTSADLGLSFFPNAVVPAGATGATFALADRVKARVVDGLVNVNAYYRVVGQQVLYVRGQEYLKVRLQERPGS